MIPLPTFDPPPPVKFTDNEKIKELYTELPSVFARDIERQKRLKLKRERAPDDIGQNAHKRQDTGESKTSTTPTSQAHPPVPSNKPNGVAQHSSPIVNHAQPGATARQALVEMSQTSSTMTAVPNPQQNSHIRQASQPHSTPPLSGVPAGSPTHSAPSQTPVMTDMQQRLPPNQAQPYAQQAINPAFAQQVAQILQDPNNQPFVKFLLQRDPQFHQRPPNVQLQQLQMIQQVSYSLALSQCMGYPYSLLAAPKTTASPSPSTALRTTSWFWNAAVSCC